MTSQYYLYSWVSECYIQLPKFNYYRDPYSLKIIVAFIENLKELMPTGLCN